MDGFAPDSVRMIKHIQMEVADLQILLFSATFNEKVRNFAMKVVKDANQVRSFIGFGASKSCEAQVEMMRQLSCECFVNQHFTCCMVHQPATEDLTFHKWEVTRATVTAAA